MEERQGGTSQRTSVKVRVLPSAKKDLCRGVHFYERQEAGVGAYFLDSISAEIDSLQLHAGVHPLRGEHHRFLAERFPFWIYYRIDDDIAYVVAVLDARQNPGRIEAREQQMSEPPRDGGR